MIGLLQRVTEARVQVEGVTIGAIATGLLVFVGVERGESEADRLLERLLGYRVFSDREGKMNLSLTDILHVSTETAAYLYPAVHRTRHGAGKPRVVSPYIHVSFDGELVLPTPARSQNQRGIR